MVAKKHRGMEREKLLYLKIVIYKINLISEYKAVNSWKIVWRFCGFNAKVEIDLMAEMPNN